MHDPEFQLLIEERAINRLMQRYCQAMDRGQEQEWIDCFTEDVLFDVRRPDGTLIHQENGHGDLARYIARYPKPPDFRKHIYTTTVLEVDLAAGEARAESYWTLLASGPGGSAVLSAFGSARDRLVKTAQGWRIKERYAVAEAM
jgi:hypothetical protein